MFTQFFGQFLLNNALITSEQLQTVFKNVKNTRLRLGMIAINEGILTAKQVEDINQLQKKHDKRFGEIAVDFQYMNQGQLDLILSKQQSEHLILAQTIVDLGFMTIEEFEESIEVYKRLHGISDESFKSLKDGKVEQVIYHMLDTKDPVIKEYVSLFYKNMIRFITDEVHISESIELSGGATYEHLFEQEIMGQKDLYSAYSGNGESLILFSEKYSGEKIDVMDEFAIDVCKEFLNLHNGLFTVNMSDKGTEYNLKIQTYKENFMPERQNLYKVPFHTNMGDFQLIIG